MWYLLSLILGRTHWDFNLSFVQPRSPCLYIFPCLSSAVLQFLKCCQINLFWYISHLPTSNFPHIYLCYILNDLFKYLIQSLNFPLSQSLKLCNPPVWHLLLHIFLCVCVFLFPWKFYVTLLELVLTLVKRTRGIANHFRLISWTDSSWMIQYKSNSQTYMVYNSEF